MCKECDSGEVEDVCYWLLQCSAGNHLRQPLLEAMDDVSKDFLTKKDADRTALILSLACIYIGTIIFHLSLISLCNGMPHVLGLLSIGHFHKLNGIRKTKKI